MPSCFTRRLSEERLDNFFYISAPAFRAFRLLSVVFLNGQHFTKLLITFAADVFVKWHNRSGSGWGRAATNDFPESNLRFTSLSQDSPYFARLAQTGQSSRRLPGKILTA
jgi:hypothetical protein